MLHTTWLRGKHYKGSSNELHTALPDRGAGSPSPQETEPRDSSAPLASGQLIDIQGLLLCMVNSEYLVARDLHWSIYTYIYVYTKRAGNADGLEMLK